MEKTIEQKTAESALQLTEKVNVGGRAYRVAKPTIGTLIMASAAISRLPQFEMKKETMVYDVLREAKNADGVGEVVAIMIVGAKGLNRRGPRRWWKQWRIRMLKRRVLEELGADELQQLIYQLFSKMHVGDFFGLIAFLSEVNITKPTKATTTASGQ